MKQPFLVILPVLCLLILAACGEDQANRASKKAVDRDSADISLRLARASEAAGDFPAAEKLFRQAVDKENTAENRGELVEFYKRHQGEKQALAVLNEALKHNPRDTSILRAIANIRINQGDSEQALKILDDALTLKPDDALLYNSRGVALDRLQRHKAARESYAKAMELDPENAVIFQSNLGMSYIMTEYYSKAIRLLEPLAASSEATPSVRQNLALAYGLKGDNQNALKYGLKDLDDKQANENIRFYTLLANKGKTVKSRPIKKAEEEEMVRQIPPIPAIP